MTELIEENKNKYKRMKNYELMLGDNIESLKKLPDNSIDSVVTDPPYGLSFMGKKWDYDVPSVDFWKEVYRVLKPGGHILSFGGTRTYHRMVVNIEDAGFEIRDQIMWIYGSGFPKSLNIGKAIDKLQGNEREVIGDNPNHRKTAGLLELGFQDGKESSTLTKGSSEFEGWGTALKPANEPICLARKPLSEKSVAENVLKWRTGGINVDGCRVGSEGGTMKVDINKDSNTLFEGGRHNSGKVQELNEGRFPANIIFECICDEVIEGETIDKRQNMKLPKTNSFTGLSEGATDLEKYTVSGHIDTQVIHTNPDCPCYQLDKQSGVLSGQIGMKRIKGQNQIFNESGSEIETQQFKTGKSDKGGASRFFFQASYNFLEEKEKEEQKSELNRLNYRFQYIPKVSKKERNMGLDGFEDKKPDYIPTSSKDDEGNMLRSDGNIVKEVINKNTHPTLKPINLLTYLCRLITPPNGIILDPFMGSGSTGIAAQLEGFRFVGMELDEDYFKIAEARISNWEQYKTIKK